MKVEIKRQLDNRFIGELTKRLAAAGKVSSVDVGFPSGKTSTPEGLPMAMVAGVHEYGSTHVPERPFLRVALREGAPEQVALNKRNLKLVIHGKMDVKTALGQLGALGVGQVQKKLSTGEFTALKPATIKRKGSSRPLIDTGAMRQAVSWELGNA